MVSNIPCPVSSVGCRDEVHFLSWSVFLTAGFDTENILVILRGQFASQNIGMVAKQTYGNIPVNNFNM